MFNFLKNKLQKIYTHFTQQVHALFARTSIDQETLNELEKLLLSADVGIKTTQALLKELNAGYKAGAIAKGSDLQQALEQQLLQRMLPTLNLNAKVYVLIGINGSGKTTCAAKLASFFKSQNKKVLLVAADTFRAAAREQLQQWGNKLEVPVYSPAQIHDPAAVVFGGCAEFKQHNYDIVIIDTAGRLQTKTHLMQELTKIKRTIARQLPDEQIYTLLTVDAMLGQNSFEQAKIFNEATDVNGIILTKMDGTGKGGIVMAIQQELNIPVAFITYGEGFDAIKLFNAQEYVTQLLGE